jgi:multiple sugar transport system permease protein
MRKAMIGALAFAMVAPFLYMMSLSFMGETELLRWPPPLLPHAPTTNNYRAVIEALPYSRVLLNTAILAACVMGGQLLTSAAAGYALARLRFPGRNGLVSTALTVLTIPAIVLLVPRYLLIDSLGWTDTFPGLISTEIVSIWGIFLMRQAFLMQPREVEDAARLDGASEWTMFWRVALPLARPAAVTLAVLAFLEQWRNFLWPLVITRSAKLQVAEVALWRMHTAYEGNWPYHMAAAVLLTIPVLLVCVLAQRYIMLGVRVTGASVRL